MVNEKLKKELAQISQSLAKH